MNGAWLLVTLYGVAFLSICAFGVGLIRNHRSKMQLREDIIEFDAKVRRRIVLLAIREQEEIERLGDERCDARSDGA